MLFKVLQVQTKSTVAFLCLFLMTTTFAVAQNCNATLSHWNLDACAPGSSYDNLTATTNFPANLTGSASIFSSMFIIQIICLVFLNTSITHCRLSEILF